MHKNTLVIDQFDTFVIVLFDLAGVNLQFMMKIQNSCSLLVATHNTENGI